MVRIFLIRSKFEEEPINKRLLKIIENHSYVIFHERQNEIATLQAILKEIPENEDIFYLHCHSIPMISRSEFDEIMNEIPKEKADLFSLCRWMDRCAQNADYRELTKDIYSVRTRGAFNLHAAWINHEARQFFLRITYSGEILKAQQDGKLYTRVTFTNCFEYDLSKAKGDVDRLRRFPCQFADPTPRSEIVSYITTTDEKRKAQVEAVKEREQKVKKEQSSWSWTNDYELYKRTGMTSGIIKLLFILLVIFLIWKVLRR